MPDAARAAAQHKTDQQSENTSSRLACSSAKASRAMPDSTARMSNLFFFKVGKSSRPQKKESKGSRGTLVGQVGHVHDQDGVLLRVHSHPLPILVRCVYDFAPGHVGLPQQCSLLPRVVYLLAPLPPLGHPLSACARFAKYIHSASRNSCEAVRQTSSLRALPGLETDTEQCHEEGLWGGGHGSCSK